MNGPQHYTEAERLLREAGAAHRESASRRFDHPETAAEVARLADSAVAVATVHALLALTAATAEARETSRYGDTGSFQQSGDNAAAWNEALRHAPTTTEEKN